MEREILIKALRCSASVKTPDIDCTSCPYRGLEEVDERIPCPTDVVVDGVNYWEYCDIEKMAIDAADYLERLGEADGV